VALLVLHGSLLSGTTIAGGGESLFVAESKATRKNAVP
jgi:hypothetical protein